MSSSYTGVADNIIPINAPATPLADDGDAVTAGARNVGLEKLTDDIAYIRRFFFGSKEEGEAIYGAVVAAGKRKLVDFYNLTGATMVREYLSNRGGGALDGRIRTWNASWNVNDAKWESDDNGAVSVLEVLCGSGVAWYGKAATASQWADADWGQKAAGFPDFVIVPGTGITTPGGATVGETLNANAVSATTTITAGGQIKATGADVTADGGNVEAMGDPATDMGRLKGLQIITSAEAKPTIAAGSALGGGTTPVSIIDGSTDVKGRLTCQTDLAGTFPATGTMLIITLDKPYPSAPEVIIEPTSDTAAALSPSPYVSDSTASGGTGGKATFTVRMPPGGTLAAGTTYGWKYHVIG